MNFRRTINAEEAVLPLRTVVILLGMALGATTLLWSARGQWDDTQQAIHDLSKKQTDLQTYIADLIVTKGGARDAQVVQINGRIDDLSKQFTALAQAQSDAHDETMKKIAQASAQAAAAAAQAQSAAEAMAHFKCQLLPKLCIPPVQP